MQVLVQGTSRIGDFQVNRQNLENPGNDAPILAADETKEEAADAPGPVWHDRQDVGHVWTSSDR